MEGAARVGDRLEEVASSFDAAAGRGGTSVHRIRLAGRGLELRFASATLAEVVMPAFAHLEVSRDERAPDLSVRIWDSTSTGAPPPPRPDVPRDLPPGALFHFDEPPLRGAYLPASETLSIVDLEAGAAWHWMEDARLQPEWEQGCPLRQILFWWLRTRGYLQVHGAAVGTSAGGVLIVGNPGSGKSTVALSCLGSALLYAGDDYVGVSAEGPPQVASLYNSGRLDVSHLRSTLPQLLPLVANAGRLESERAVLYVHPHFPDQATSGFPLRGVLVSNLGLDARTPQVEHASRAAALAALAPTTMLQLHTAGATELATMARLVESIPCFSLEIGSDLRAVPGVLTGLLSELPSL